MLKLVCPAHAVLTDSSASVFINSIDESKGQVNQKLLFCFKDGLPSPRWHEELLSALFPD